MIERFDVLRNSTIYFERLNMCRVKMISVPVEHLKQMAELISNLDLAQAKNAPKQEYRALVEEMHKTNMDMLGAHVDLVYAPEGDLPVLTEIHHQLATTLQ